MKILSLPTAILFMSFSAFAEKNIEAEINKQPIEIQIGIMAMKSCMEQYIAPAKLEGLEQRIDNAVKRVEGYCHNKDEERAYNAVLGYSQQPETKVFLKCAAQLKPLIESPSVQKLIGKHTNLSLIHI